MYLLLQDAKIEELMRLKKELEELKANWQTNNDNLLVDDPPPETKARSACQNKSKEDMVLLTASKLFPLFRMPLCQLKF